MTLLRSAVLCLVVVGLGASCVHDQAKRYAAGGHSVGERVDRYLSTLHERGRFAGYALVAKADVSLFSKGYSPASGAHDASTRRPYSENTPSPVASVTKMFTAAAVLVCPDDGLLSLDDPAASYVPDAGVDPAVTVEHLLMHTGGLEDDAAPRLGFSYSNRGYRLLGDIVAVASGMSYAAFMHRRVLEPLGLADSHIDVSIEGPNGAAGGLACSPADLLRWSHHLATAGPDATLSFGSLTADTVEVEPGLRYGYGITARTIKAAGHEHQMYWHAGTMPGYGAELCYLPEYDLTVILQVTGEDVDQQRIIMDVLELVLAEK